MFIISSDIRTVIFVRSIIIIKYYCYCYYDDLMLIRLWYVSVKSCMTLVYYSRVLPKV